LIRTSIFIMAIGVVASSASAAPLVKGSLIAPTHDVVNVKIVCEQDGHCNYGRPGKHWAWWAFLGF